MEVTGVSSITALTTTVEQQDVGAQVVSKTLDKVNQYTAKDQAPVYNASNADYDFQKSVLGAYAGKGTLINSIV